MLLVSITPAAVLTFFSAALCVGPPKPVLEETRGERDKRYSARFDRCFFFLRRLQRGRMWDLRPSWQAGVSCLKREMLLFAGRC